MLQSPQMVRNFKAPRGDLGMKAAEMYNVGPGDTETGVTPSDTPLKGQSPEQGLRQPEGKDKNSSCRL